MRKCNQCDSMTINGVYCHEKGCPNINKVWDDELEMWIDKEYEGMGDGLNDDWDEDYQSSPEDFED